MAACKFPDPNDMSRYARIERLLSDAGDNYVSLYKHKNGLKMWTFELARE
jgi:hypothetical protein